MMISYAHLDPLGKVWASDGRSGPYNTGEAYTTYVPRHVDVRILGTRENAPLILSLVQRAVGNIQLAAGPPPLLEPSEAILHAYQCQLAASLGGWHPLNHDVDLPAYRLAMPQMAPHRIAVAKTHPVWYELHFIEHLNQEAAAELLALIIDPRWHIDPQSPNRMTRLLSYLGVTPDVYNKMAALHNSPRTRRLKLVLDCFYCFDAVANKSPGRFLARIVKHAKNKKQGALRAARTFLAYLIHNWYQRIAVLSGSRQAEPLFVPELLLTEEESRAYSEFVKTRPRGSCMR